MTIHVIIWDIDTINENLLIVFKSLLRKLHGFEFLGVIWRK